MLNVYLEKKKVKSHHHVAFIQVVERVLDVNSTC